MILEQEQNRKENLSLRLNFWLTNANGFGATCLQEFQQ